MRTGNEYKEKVIEELNVYQKYLLTGGQTYLTPTQAQTFEKLGVIRAWLSEGYSEAQVITMARIDPRTRLQERRAREVVYLAYEIFADLRMERNEKAVKEIYAQVYSEAAQKALFVALKLFEDERFVEGAMVLKEFRYLKKEAGKIEGVYNPDAADTSEKKRPQQFIFEVMPSQQPRKIEDTTFELEEDEPE